MERRWPRPKADGTKLLDGDVLDYFVGSDAENQNDYYTWLEVPATMTSGEDITVTVKGVKAMDPDATQAAAQPLEGVGLAWVDMATGTVKPIEGVVTDENGKATFTVVEGAATGRLVAITATYHTHTTYALMNPSAPIQMVTGNVHTVELKGLHNAQLNSLKLYTYKDGVKGTQDLLSGISTEADGYGLKYTVSLPSGTYWADGYDANKDCNGGVMLAIADDTTSVSLQRAYEIYARNSGWVAGTDYTIDYQVTTADGVKRTATLGQRAPFTAISAPRYLRGDGYRDGEPDPLRGARCQLQRWHQDRCHEGGRRRSVLRHLRTQGLHREGDGSRPALPSAWVPSATTIPISSSVRWRTAPPPRTATPSP